MPQTLSVIKADVGGFVGHSAMHEDVMDAGREAMARAIQSSLLIDAHVSSCGDDMFLIMSHDRGEDDTEVHRLAWDAFVAGTEVAKRLSLYGAGQDLLADAFSGNIRGMGPGSAELELEERPSEPVIVLMADKTSAGAFNLPFYKMFADPFNTAGLVISEALHDGFAFEVHDVKEHRKIVFNSPEELYDLLVFIGSPARFAVKRVVARQTGEVAAVSSTDKLSLIAGRYVGKDDPAAVIRCQGAFPAVGEVLEPFTHAWIVEGFMRGSHYGPLMPVGRAQATPARFDGPPRLVALGFQLAQGKLVGPRDMFDDPSFDNARSEANRVADHLRKHGPFEPHRLPLDEMEYTTMPAVAAKMASRWDSISARASERERRADEVEPRISLITLGVRDLAQALRFYRDGLGWPVSGEGSEDVAFLKTSGAVISLYPRHLLAEDASMPPGDTGSADAFPGFALAHNVASKELVDQVLATAVDAGARLVKPAVDVFWGGYSGYFADPDGFLWEVAWNPGWPLREDGSVLLPD